MKRYEVILSARAETNLEKIHHYFAKRFSKEAADRFRESILNDCEAFSLGPKRGLMRPQVGKNVRRIGVAKNRVSVAFRVEHDHVVIIGIHYAGKLLN